MEVSNATVIILVLLVASIMFIFGGCGMKCSASPEGMTNILDNDYDREENYDAEPRPFGYHPDKLNLYTSYDLKENSCANVPETNREMIAPYVNSVSGWRHKAGLPSNQIVADYQAALGMNHVIKAFENATDCANQCDLTGDDSERCHYARMYRNLLHQLPRYSS